MAKGSRPLPLPGLRGGAATWPKRGHTTHWPLTGHLLAKGLRPPPPPTGQRRGTATLRGATPSPASHWPLATPHRVRGPSPRPHWGRRGLRHSGPHTTGASLAKGELWPNLATPLGAPLRGHSPLWPSGEALHREGAAHRPYWGAGPSLAIGLWATGLPLATYWPSGEGPLASDWPPTPTGHPLRGGPHPSLATYWPLATSHRGRAPLSGHRAKTPLATFGHTHRAAPLLGQKR